MQLPNNEPINDPENLWALQLELLAMAEGLYGQRDQSFRIFRPQFCKCGPNIRIEYAPRGAYAELSYSGRFYRPTVVYELAHETVHLLNPVRLDEANYLEEGVAVAFSIIAQPLCDVSNSELQGPSSIKAKKYFYALTLANSLPGGHEAAGRIREEFGRLSDATPEGLLSLFPDLDEKDANDLTRKFNHGVDPSNPDSS